jgi:site-specific DNA-methyltransferase (adenine-specific)
VIKPSQNEPMMDQIYNHSCESMPEIESGRVSLTVTSPPYWNAIDYDIHARGQAEDYRTRAYSQGFSAYSDYLDWLSIVFQEVLRVTKPGGFCAIVVGTVLLNGDHYPVPFDLVARLNREGWLFHQDIIWHKCTAGVKRAGVSIQRPYPGYYYPNIMSEYILIFRKPGAKIFQERDPEERTRSSFPINRVFTMDIANNIWHIAPIPPGMLEHPAPFPEEIPYRLVQLYSYQGDLVLDPFTGSGQTLKIARALGRHYLGYEIIPQYIELANRRLQEPLSIRSQQLVSSFDKVDLNDPIAASGLAE